MSKKQKQEIVKKIEDATSLKSYLNEEFSKKLVCINVYDKFWGLIEIADPVIKRFIDSGNNVNMVEFLAVEQGLIDQGSQNKVKIQSKPVYFIYYVIILSYKSF